MLGINITDVLLKTIEVFSQFLQFLLFVRVVLSWVSLKKHSGFVKIIYSLTEPILLPIRNIIYKSPLGGPGMSIDFSPVIAMFLIQLVRNILFRIIV